MSGPVLVHDSDAALEAEGGHWITPVICHGVEVSESEGIVAVRFSCQTHDVHGGWAFGPDADPFAVIEQAKLLGPDCGG